MDGPTSDVVHGMHRATKKKGQKVHMFTFQDSRHGWLFAVSLCGAT
jgi:hypothetical protein